jgi:hypothetical protein
MDARADVAEDLVAGRRLVTGEPSYLSRLVIYPPILTPPTCVDPAAGGAAVVVGAGPV